MLRAVTAGLLCLLSGIAAAQRLSQRERTMRYWYLTLENLRAHCACLCLPPEELWQMSVGNTSLPASIERAREEILQAPLKKDEKSLLCLCLQALLEGTQEQQERQLKYACAFFEKRLAQAEEKQRQDAKLYGMLGVFGGLCIFLVCV